MKKLKGIFLNERGELRTGWQIALGLAAGFGTLFGVELLLGFLFGRLFEVWGLTNENLAYAPLYAQRIVFWHTDFTYALAYGLSILVSVLLARRRTQPVANNGRMVGIGALSGAVCGAVLTAVALVFDSMRLEWPLGEAQFSLKWISGIAVLLLACVSSEVMGKRLIFDPMRQRFGRIAGFAAAGIFAALSGLTLPGMLNGMLFGLIGCVLYERGGIYASAALRTGWMVWTHTVFAWPESGSVSLYRLYTVSDAWMTGGNAGADAGLGCTVILIILASILLRQKIALVILTMKRRRDTNGKDSHCDRGLRIKR